VTLANRPNAETSDCIWDGPASPFLLHRMGGAGPYSQSQLLQPCLSCPFMTSFEMLTKVPSAIPKTTTPS